MVRKLFTAAAIVALLTGTAAAQLPMPGISLGGDHKRKVSPEEEERQQALDKSYNSAMQKIPEKKADPWGNIRSAPPSAAQNKQ